ncbi:MAG: hypothetical protein HY056_10170 [Proteobacteria bacterium]|nr:hypothetical protein [Pseudomonadota bacterium]
MATTVFGARLAAGKAFFAGLTDLVAAAVRDFDFALVRAMAASGLITLGMTLAVHATHSHSSFSAFFPPRT